MTRTRTEDVLALLRSGVALVSPGREFEFVNDAWLAAMGGDAAAWAGASLDSVRQPEGEALRAIADDALRDGATHAASFTRDDVLLEATASRIPDGALLLELRPAAARECESEAPARAIQAKSDFIATVSHELRTPLAALAGYGELLAEEITGPLNDAQRDLVERMRSVTLGLSHIVNEILTYSSLESGGERFVASDVDLAEVLAEVAQEIAPLAREKGLALSLHDVPSLVLRTDRDKLRKILQNLVTNAVKFTDRGSVDISCRTGGGEVRIIVRDTGVGITPAEMSRLFQPFAQLESGLTRRRGGTGLGLFIAKRLAAMLGGRIDVSSVPGMGSTFALVLPAGGEPPDR